MGGRAALNAEIAAFLDARGAGRRPVLSGITIPAEEMLRGL